MFPRFIKVRSDLLCHLLMHHIESLHLLESPIHFLSKCLSIFSLSFSSCLSDFVFTQPNLIISYVNICFSEREEMIKGEYAAVGGNSPKDRRRKKMLKRIHEYEKFVDNCQRYKEYERQKKNQGKDRRHTLTVLGNRVTLEKLQKRSKSLTSFDKERATWNDRYSVPLLPDFDYKISLDERILLWQSMDADGSFFENV